MLIKAGEHEIQAVNFKVKGKSTIRVGDYNVKTTMTLRVNEDGLEILVPNSTGLLYVRKSSEMKSQSFLLKKNEPADLFVKGGFLTLGTNEGDFVITIDNNTELVFKSGAGKVLNYTDPVIKKILKLTAKKAMTRYEIFEAVLSKEEYLRFAYGSGKHRSLNYYSKYLWPLVDAGKLQSIDGLSRRYTNLFKAVV